MGAAGVLVVQEQKNKDNILPKLMAGGAGEPGDALFKEELKKYDDLVKEVSQQARAPWGCANGRQHRKRSTGCKELGAGRWQCRCIWMRRPLRRACPVA